MEVTLGERTEETVRIYFERSKQPEIRKNLPQKEQNLEQTIEEFHCSQGPGSTSFGRTIWADGRYVGDVWCYGLNGLEVPNAMVSYCVFEVEAWGRGIGSRGVELFLEEVRERLGLKSFGAFVYADNLPSIRVLEKNGFCLSEEFEEEGVLSRFYLKTL